MNDRPKWYDNKFLTHFLLVVFFPAGLYALWKSRTIAKWWKVVVTITIALFVFASLGSNEQTSGNAELETLQKSNLSAEQLDSIKMVERLKEIEDRKSSTISAKQLLKDYEDNEVKADQQYKDKYLYVTGNIDNIGKDILDDIYVTLKGTNFLFGVQCYIEDENVVSELKKGMYVTVFGRCDGKLGNVGMQDCKVVKNLEDL